MKNQKNRKIFNSSLLICPVCGKKSFSVYQIVEDIPYFGEVLETFAHCNSCNYKTYDMLMLGNQRHPQIQKFVMSSIKDLSKRVVKSKYCSIEIPSIDLRISPGSSSEAYISNVEGLLDRIIDSLKSIESLTPGKKTEFDEKIKILNRAKKGNLKLEIIFDDPTGQSAILLEEPTEVAQS